MVGGQMAPHTGGSGSIPVAAKEPPNTATICKIGQETVQEIVTRCLYNVSNFTHFCKTFSQICVFLQVCEKIDPTK
jgi:hypothetical protein